MIIVMKPKAKPESILGIKEIIEEKGLQAHISDGHEVTIIGVVGDKAKLMDQNLEIYEDVDRIVPVTESYKFANKKFHPEPTKVKVGNITIGGDTMVIMSGPCAVESKEATPCYCPCNKKGRSSYPKGRCL